MLTDYYSTAHTPPTSPSAIVPSTATACGNALSSVCQAGEATPLAEGGKVVAKTWSGFGEPETVTVGALAAAAGTLELGDAVSAPN